MLTVVLLYSLKLPAVLVLTFGGASAGFTIKGPEEIEARALVNGLDLSIAADSFTAMLFGGMLRNTAGCAEDYPPETYVATCVDVFAAGLAPVPCP